LLGGKAGGKEGSKGGLRSCKALLEGQREAPKDSGAARALLEGKRRAKKDSGAWKALLRGGEKGQSMLRGDPKALRPGWVGRRGKALLWLCVEGSP